MDKILNYRLLLRSNLFYLCQMRTSNGQGQSGGAGLLGSHAANVKNPEVCWKEKWGKETRGEGICGGELGYCLSKRSQVGEVGE